MGYHSKKFLVSLCILFMVIIVYLCAYIVMGDYLCIFMCIYVHLCVYIVMGGYLCLFLINV